MDLYLANIQRRLVKSTLLRVLVHGGRAEKWLPLIRCSNASLSVVMVLVVTVVSTPLILFSESSILM